MLELFLDVSADDLSLLAVEEEREEEAGEEGGTPGAHGLSGSSATSR